MKMLRPLRDRVLVHLDGEEEFTKSGLVVIPEIARYPKPRGTVLSVGPGLTTRGKYIPIPLVPGDRVWLNKLAPFTGLPIELDGGSVTWHGYEIKLQPCVAYLVYEADILGLIGPDFDEALMTAPIDLPTHDLPGHLWPPDYPK